MAIFSKLGETIASPVNADGTPRSPAPQDFQVWMTEVERLVNSVLLSGGTVFASKAAMNADLNHTANSLAIVLGDPVPNNNGLYIKVGTAGVGSWQRIGDLPWYSVIRAINAGAGTANEIVATTTLPIPEADANALIIFNIVETNTGSVTISLNGRLPLSVTTSSGALIHSGYFVPGMLVTGIIAEGKFRLLSDVASMAIQIAAEAAMDAAEEFRDQAAEYANFARNNWAIAASGTGTGSQDEFTLLIDPASKNNMFVSVGGIIQQIGSYDLVYALGVPRIRFGQSIPEFETFEVRVSNAININAPSDGSVTPAKLADSAVETAKVADKAITLAKQADVPTSRIMGRVTPGSGSQEELTAAQVRDNFFPVGSVVDSVRGAYTANADLTSGIPVDDTIPEITEGTEIISLVLTPKSVTNKFRIRFVGQGTLGTVSGASSIVAAVFAGATGSVPVNARGAVLDLVSASNFTAILALECEYTPGSMSPQTISVRVGPTTGTGYTMRMNGNPTTRRFGGASAASLVVEEIKG